MSESAAERALRAVSGGLAAESGTGLPSIPAVPLSNDPSVNNFLSAVKLWLEKAGSSGLSGFAKNSDLVDAGILSPSDGTGDGDVHVANPISVLVPPAPTGLTAIGAITNIILQWDNPFKAYNNHAYAEIWAAETDNFSIAEPVGQSSGFMFNHSVGPGATRYYWVRFVGQSGVNTLTNGPFSSVNGLMAQTAQDPTWLLEALTGQLTENQLYEDLSSRINLIDAPDTTPGSVSERIKSSFDTLSTTVDDNTASIQTNATSIDGINAKYTVKIDNNGYVTGYGLISSDNNGTPTSEFMIVADKFSIAPVQTSPSEVNGSPFFHLTSPTTINDVVVPAGTYIKDAFIANLNASKIVAGTLAADRIVASVMSAVNASVENLEAAKMTANVINAINASVEYINANRIDTRGLSIKDASGNVIFSSGTPLSVSRISGLGSLAQQSTVNVSQVLGLGSLATQSHINWNTQLINIPAFGNFAWLSSISSANISTYIAAAAIGEAYIANAAITNAKIANGAITSAKIGAAEVDTLRLAGNAVTIQQVATGTTSATISHNCSGGSIIIVASGDVLGHLIDEQNSTGGYIQLAVSITGYGIVAGTRMPCIPEAQSFAVSAWSGPVSAGTRSFSVSVSGDYVSAGSCRIAILEAKR